MTTWGDLKQGDTILDQSGNDWEVSAPQRIGETVQAGIRRGVTYTVVRKPASEEVRVPFKTRDLGQIREQIQKDVQEIASVTATHPDIQDLATKVQEAFGDQKVELLATETTEEAEARKQATSEKPLLLPEIDRGFELRSHLYLVHDFFVAEETNNVALSEHHRRSHELNQGTPHIHGNVS